MMLSVRGLKCRLLASLVIATLSVMFVTPGDAVTLSSSPVTNDGETFIVKQEGIVTLDESKLAAVRSVAKNVKLQQASVGEDRVPAVLLFSYVGDVKFLGDLISGGKSSIVPSRIYIKVDEVPQGKIHFSKNGQPAEEIPLAELPGIIDFTASLHVKVLNISFADKATQENIENVIIRLLKSAYITNVENNQAAVFNASSNGRSFFDQ